MKKVFDYCCMMLLLVVTTGCPYESELPLDEPTVAMPAQLPGTWISSDDSTVEVLVTAADANRFYISYSEDTVTTERFSAHLSLLRNTWFLNLHPIGAVRGLKGGYAFYRFELSADGKHITLTPVTENMTERFTSSRQMRKFFIKHMRNSFFYDGDETVEYEKLR